MNTALWFASGAGLEAQVITALPPLPTRDEVCGVGLVFAGITVDTQQYGRVPYFEGALPWFDLAIDRQRIYAAKRAAGNGRHAVVGLPNGTPLYDEPPPNFYTADRFPAKDWTAQNTRIDPAYIALVTEVVQAGFIPICPLDERSYRLAVAQLRLVVPALRAAGLERRVLVVPGWDGVFYGWTPEEIAQFGREFRYLLPDGYLAIEHQPGRIPIGNGSADWAIDGPMSTYDTVLSEFDYPTTQDNMDQVYQIGGRLLGPAYRRPAEQIDDPNPPFYLVSGTPRGPYFAVKYESWDVYRWVRGQTTVQALQSERAFFKALGWKFTG